MAAPTYTDLGALLGRTVTSEQGTAVLSIITAMVSSYTRGEGFTNGIPNDELRAVILTASCRLLSNPSALLYSDTAGPEAVEYRSAFQGFSAAELFVLNRFRVRGK